MWDIFWAAGGVSKAKLKEQLCIILQKVVPSKEEHEILAVHASGCRVPLVKSIRIDIPNAKK